MANRANAISKLMREKNNWRIDHPEGFVARPAKNEDKTLNILEWDCEIPGKEGTLWEGGIYKLKMIFTDEYPNTPPRCYFEPPVFHPNVSMEGWVDASILNCSTEWNPSITIKDILLRIQQLLVEPITEADDILHADAYFIYLYDKEEYDRRIKEQAQFLKKEKL